MEIKLSLTIEDVNAIISVLGMLPFNQAAGIIGKVREQAIPQVQAAEAAAKAAAENSESANDVETSTDSEGGETA
jgi:hypothetical protein